MAKLSLTDLKKIREKALREISVRQGGKRGKITVHLGACGIEAGARAVMDSLLSEIARAEVTDLMVTASGCAGMCSKEPMVTVEILGQEPVIYGRMDADKMRRVFRRHVLRGEIQTMFAIAGD